MLDNNNEKNDIQDPLSGIAAESEKDSGHPEKKEKKSFWLFGKKKRSEQENQIIRIEELKARIEAGEDIDPDEVVSMYMPHRRAKIIGAAILRMDKLRLFLLCAIVFLGALFILAFMQEKMGNFTINLDRLELYRKGIAISDDAMFTNPTARLTASAIEDATNISVTDIPTDVDDIDGDHNGTNYMAYTYYVRNAGKEDVSYVAAVTLDSCSKGAEDAVRVAVWKNDEEVIYAMPSADGTPEDGCENFLTDTVVCKFEEDEFLIGNVDKYTIVIWMEGDDPECVDAIVGGSVQFSMKIAAASDDDSTLLEKFIQDIIDTVNDDKPISAAGTESPDFQKYSDVTWYTRRNQ